MDALTKRQQLHQFIDSANDSDIVALYEYVQNSMSGHAYTPEELRMLHERADKFVKGTAIAFTVEEAHNYIRASRTYDL